MFYLGGTGSVDSYDLPEHYELKLSILSQDLEEAKKYG